VAERSESLNEMFRQNATDTTEAVLESYVDFIFLALNRFRSEMETLNTSFRKELETSIALIPAPAPKDPVTISTPSAIDLPANGPSAATTAEESQLIPVEMSPAEPRPASSDA
jgi:hypothetical protein